MALQRRRWVPLQRQQTDQSLEHTERALARWRPIVKHLGQLDPPPEAVPVLATMADLLGRPCESEDIHRMDQLINQLVRAWPDWFMEMMAAAHEHRSTMEVPA